MTRRGLEIRVGAVVVVAAVIAVVGTMWFQRFRLVEKRYPFFVQFEEIGGLVPGDPIHINGVELGRVNGVSLGAGRVTVEMGVREGVPVPDDSRIVLKSIGIMGERFVEITQGRSPRLVAPGDTLDGTFLMGLSEVMGSAGGILEEVERAARSVREVAESLASEGRVGETMQNLADVSGSLRDMTTGEDAALANAIARFDHTATLLDSLVATHYAALDTSLAAVGRAGGRIEVAAGNLEAISDDIRDITRALRDGEGTAGRLIYSDSLAVRMESATARLDSLIDDIKMRPGRYVTFKLF
jgi:phospholipid/cholesterol/gamma-HCH transport system substrate-binding protein